MFRFKSEKQKTDRTGDKIRVSLKSLAASHSIGYSVHGQAAAKKKSIGHVIDFNTFVLKRRTTFKSYRLNVVNLTSEWVVSAVTTFCPFLFYATQIHLPEAEVWQ
jgi:hypothetical protein